MLLNRSNTKRCDECQRNHSNEFSNPKVRSIVFKSQARCDGVYADICESAGVGHARKKTMTSLVCLSERSFRDSKWGNKSRDAHNSITCLFCLAYEDYIFADVRKRHDLAFAWLYQEYAYANGYLNMLDPNRRKDFTKYDDTLCRLLEYLQEKPDQRDGYLLLFCKSDRVFSTLNFCFCF